MKLVAASAPGKLMISGEYAVLDGALAVVAAAGARVYARWVEARADARERNDVEARADARERNDDAKRAGELPREAAETRRLAEQSVGQLAGELSIDASELRRAGKKVGLGSSAAASAAVAGAVLASHGQDLRDPAVQRRAFELALAGHKAIAPEGSGADVAAAALGGFVRFRLVGAKAEAERVPFPDALETRVVWTGQEARTSEFVRAVRAFEARDGAGFARVRDELRAQASRFAEAIALGDLTSIIGATHAYGQAMGELGRAAGVPIVTRELAEIARLAAAHGGAAKPSGAGGGDVAIALFPAREGAAAFDRACAEAGFEPRLERLDLTLGAPGVRTE